ncbi:putative apyrase [Neospora caninum Liverpool]|uniref:Putative apyrase n=1 Tax=Neospora caninum (strain Liverpool) TaxID=572307 RepID=F0VMW5_NEOCL|nr:putative apyrase [Neospora caninum Liverpool]CBZ55061.1 putative apyrase [Neospora caninum Liverpool]|eukprot:XP_003885089.1 putative apyrase [Neospora caninum Liverpool]
MPAGGKRGTKTPGSPRVFPLSCFLMLSLSSYRPASLLPTSLFSALPSRPFLCLLIVVILLLLSSSWTLTRLAQPSVQNDAAVPPRGQFFAPEGATQRPREAVRERTEREKARDGPTPERRHSLPDGAEAQNGGAGRLGDPRVPEGRPEGSRELISRGETSLKLHADRLRGRGAAFPPGNGERKHGRDARDARLAPEGPNDGARGRESRGRPTDFVTVPGTCGSAERPCAVVFIADLDVQSRVDASGKSGELLFKSYAIKGQLYRRGGGASARQAASSLNSSRAGSAETDWSGETEFDFAFSPDGFDVLYGSHNVGGRGMELSELVVFNGELLTFDDRTGIIYRFNLKNNHLVPKWLLVEGDGVSSDKGMKIEWATVKHEKLYPGSHACLSPGPPFLPDNSGNVLHRHNTWVVIIDGEGRISREDWAGVYELMKKWVVLPRRVSEEPYDDVKDERRGSNKLLLCSEDFTNIDVVDIQTPPPIDPRKGFSSFKFVPGTGDKVILAVKSLEDSSQDVQQSFVTIFDITGRVLLPDIPFPHESKYEGVAFV